MTVKSFSHKIDEVKEDYSPIKEISHAISSDRGRDAGVRHPGC